MTTMELKWYCIKMWKARLIGAKRSEIWDSSSAASDDDVVSWIIFNQRMTSSELQAIYRKWNGTMNRQIVFMRLWCSSYSLRVILKLYQFYGKRNLHVLRPLPKYARDQISQLCQIEILWVLFGIRWTNEERWIGWWRDSIFVRV